MLGRVGAAVAAKGEGARERRYKTLFYIGGIQANTSVLSNPSAPCFQYNMGAPCVTIGTYNNGLYEVQ